MNHVVLRLGEGQIYLGPCLLNLTLISSLHPALSQLGTVKGGVGGAHPPVFAEWESGQCAAKLRDTAFLFGLGSH